MELIPLNIPFILLALATLVSLRLVHLAVSRLVLHPLAKVPDPKLAALTHLYEFYHDAIRAPQFTFQIDDFHRTHGELSAQDCLPLLNSLGGLSYAPTRGRPIFAIPSSSINCSTSMKLNKNWYYY